VSGCAESLYGEPLSREAEQPFPAEAPLWAADVPRCRSFVLAGALGGRADHSETLSHGLPVSDRQATSHPVWSGVSVFRDAVGMS